jgi:hypothetical protein
LRWRGDGDGGDDTGDPRGEGQDAAEKEENFLRGKMVSERCSLGEELIEDNVDPVVVLDTAAAAASNPNPRIMDRLTICSMRSFLRFVVMLRLEERCSVLSSLRNCSNFLKKIFLCWKLRQRM